MTKIVSFNWLEEITHKYRGNQVPTAELEAGLLFRHMVKDAGVCGVWDKRLKIEIPVAYVNLSESVGSGNREAALEEIRAYVEGRVTPYKT